MKIILYLIFTSLFAIASCGTDDNSRTQNDEVEGEIITNTSDSDDKEEPTEEPTEEATNGAKIVSVAVSGEATSYTFNVGISSPDTGCDQYANWWEVITVDGVLLYRRILGHSHVDEQPFVRSGGSINATEDQILIIRPHMNNLGYGTQVYKGSVNSGFSEMIIETTFASNLAEEEPLPSGCDF